MKGVAALAFGLVAVSCNKSDIFNPSAQQEENEKKSETAFAENVMDGQAIDANQTWATASPSSITATVNLNYGETYTLYITESNPLTDSDAKYLGVASIKSGNTKTFTITRPSGQGGYFAALYDKNNHAIVKPFAIENGETKISFGETTQSSNRAASTGNRWSVETKSMPNLTAYTTGELYEMEEAFNTNGSTVVNQADGSEKHLKITGTYSGAILRLQSYANQSVYVTGTWNVPADQRVTGSSVVVVGPNGVINIPEGNMLSTNANNNEGTTGMIYVMPGGKITGAGTLQFSNGTETFSYNGGTLTVKDININGGTLYNAGQIGGVTGEYNPALTGPAGTPANPSKFINMGHATLASVGGAGIAVDNACNLQVIGLMELGKSSKMDGGSYTECGSLKLAGSNNGDITMYMGPAAYLKNKGDFNVNNYGVWGPTSGTNAIFELSNEVSYANMTANLPGTQMLDHVELIIPEDYPAEILNGGYNTNYAGYVIYGWFNGLYFTTINPDAFTWEQNHDKYGDWDWHKTNVANKNSWTYTNNANVTDDRRTCLLGNSPSYAVEADEDGCGTTFVPEENIVPETNYIYYAFEDLGTTNDFDFNDVVIRVSTPDAQGKSTVELMCAGGTMSTVVTYGTGDNPRIIGSEVHEALGASSYKVMVNTGSGETKPFPVTLGTIEGLNAQTDMANLPFGIKCEGNNGQVIKVVKSVANNGKAPLVIVVSGDENGKWYWPTEFTNISIAYPGFGEWGANVEDHTDWYKNAAGSVYAW